MSTSDLFCLDNVVKIYVPGTVNVNESAADLQAVETKAAAAFLAGLFGGSTFGRYSGAWIDSKGQTIIEDVNIVYSFCSGDSFRANFEAVYNYCRDLCGRMNQEAISLEFNGRLTFVEA